MKRLGRKRMVLSARIENKYDRTNKGDHLRRGKFNEEGRAERVERIARGVISHDLPNDMEEIFGLSVRSNIIAVRDGSVILFFEIILAGYNLIADYKGFFESIGLIKSQCQRLLESALRNEFGEDFEISVGTEYPSVPEPADRVFRRWLDHWRHFEPDMFPPMFFGRESRRRDGFFYYLLILNVILFLVVGFLTYAAVIKVYFP